jgi:hypothetical protein
MQSCAQWEVRPGTATDRAGGIRGAQDAQDTLHPSKADLQSVSYDVIVSVVVTALPSMEASTITAGSRVQFWI